MSDLWQVQVAVMAKLNSTEGLPTIYDVVPKEAARPYGTFGTPTATRRGVLARPTAQRNNVVLDWWSSATNDHGSLGLEVIGNKVVAATSLLAKQTLDGQLLVLGIGSMVMLRWRGDTYLPEPDRNVRRIQQVYTIDTQ